MNEGHPHLKPKITAAEASWHEHIAGQRAAEAARSQGANPDATAAVATATAGPAVIAGHTLQPASQGTVWALQRAAGMFEAWAEERNLQHSPDPAAPGTRELLELGLTTIVFMHPRRAWLEMERGDFPALIARADALVWDLPLADAMSLREHFEREMATIRRLAGEEDEDPAAKKPRPDGLSAANPTPPPAEASPPSNGFAPNTPT